MRYTEYHAGKAVIKDRSLLPQAMETLAKIEDMTGIPQICCDEYCKHPDRVLRQEDLGQICANCKLAPLFEMLIN